MHSLLRKFSRLHWGLVVTTFVLIAWGVWAIYNATSFREGHLSTIWRIQIQWAGFGTVVFVVAALIDYRWVRWGGWLGYLSSVALLALFWFFARSVHRPGQIYFLSLSLSTSQVALVATVLTLAVVLGHLHLKVPLFRHHWMRILVAGGLAVIPMGILLKQPDVGAVWVLGLVLGLMLLVASIPWRYLTVLFVVVMCLVPLWYHFGLKPYQKKRMEVFGQMLTNQKLDLHGEAYMADKLKVAVGSAGFSGKGPLSRKVEGRSVHRTFFTPTEACSDFIFAVIAEEFGFRGGLLQIVAIGLQLLLCIYVSYRARDELGRMLVMGIVALFFVLSMQNIGMNVLMMPITDLPLPFTSYGGIFLVMCMFLMGLVQSVWVHRDVSLLTAEQSAEVEPQEAPDGNAVLPDTGETAVPPGIV